MKITPQNLVKHELVGLSTHIVESKDPNHVSTKGTILGESRELIKIDTGKGTIAVSKNICVFDITLPDGTVVRIDGGLLRGRPEDRMKKRLNRSW
ncbi:MAG: ribonuclease P protein component 1 [Candidatus Thorarchaeota archaeon]|jgi:ribonuclease P protein subunit POP4